MAWKLVYHAEEPADGRVGDVWPAPHWANSNLISQRYLHEVADKRPPLMCLLPSVAVPEGDRFLLDRYGSDDPSRKGWDVIIVGELIPGTTPDITLKPSINCKESYHGYITHGVISDDCEGRTYPNIVARHPA